MRAFGLRSVLFEVPAIDASLFIESNALRLQKASLPEGAFGGEPGKTSVLSDDPMPRHILRTGVHGPADLPCHARVACQKGRLAVAYDLSGRNRADDIIDAFKEALRTAAVRPFRGGFASGGPGSGIP